MNAFKEKINSEGYISCHIQACSSCNEAIEALRKAYLNTLDDKGLDTSDIIFIRFFCSDVYTQAPLLEHLWAGENACQSIFIGQTPLDSTYISLQAYYITGTAEKSVHPDGSLLVRHGSYQSLWTLDYPPVPGNSRQQSDSVIASYQNKLHRHGMQLEHDVIRTWYYVRDVDNNYAGMVESRICHYEANGLTPQTHFIASTGIEACAPRPDVLVWLHSYAELGLQKEQITYLKALQHLSPTHVYNVNFERATRVAYGDRAHCHISGTASIDHVGNVLYKTDVVRQFERVVENVEALLREGGMKLEDMKSATVYLRDCHDYASLAPMVKNVLPQECAINITHGPVCRPDWLVEMEAEAVAPDCSDYPPFF